MTRTSANPELAKALQKLGARRAEALLLAALAQQNDLGTRDLVQRTSLRQPEVSTGMQWLRDRGWVSTEPMARKGKGRPMHRYRLISDLAPVRQHYEAHGRQVIDDLLAAIAAVKRHLA